MCSAKSRMRLLYVRRVPPGGFLARVLICSLQKLVEEIILLGNGIIVLLPVAAK